MGISTLTTLKTNYSATNASTMIPKFYAELIAILTTLDTKIDELDTKLDALEARVETLEG